MRTLNQLDLAWAAGFLDGEGCWTVSHHGSKTQEYCNLQVAQVDRRPLDRLTMTFGFGKVSGPYEVHPAGKYVCKAQYKWNLCNFEQMQAATAMVWKFLSDPKREQITRAFKRIKK